MSGNHNLIYVTMPEGDCSCTVSMSCADERYEYNIRAVYALLQIALPSLTLFPQPNRLCCTRKSLFVSPFQRAQLFPQPQIELSTILIIHHSEERSTEMCHMVKQPTSSADTATIAELVNSPPTPDQSNQIQRDHTRHSHSYRKRNKWYEDQPHTRLGISARRQGQSGIDRSTSP